MLWRKVDVNKKINKDIRKYTEKIVLGLTLRQTIFSILSCIVAVIVYFVSIDTLGSEITSWFCIVCAIPFAALGFIDYQGMNAEQLVVCIIKSIILKNRKLQYSTTNVHYEIIKNRRNDYIKELKKNNVKDIFKRSKEQKSNE